MSTPVTITNNARPGGAVVVITVQTICDDGRERKPNGSFAVLAGKSKDLFLDADQCLRISEEVAPASTDTAPVVEAAAQGEAQ